MKSFDHFTSACGVAAAFLSGPACAMCFQLYDAHDRLIYRSQAAPVNMSASDLSHAVETRYPGAQLSITTEQPCTHLDLTTPAGRAQAAARQQLQAALLQSRYVERPTDTAPLPSSAATQLLAPTQTSNAHDRVIERQVIETRTETIYVPVAVAGPHHVNRQRAHDGRATVVQPSAPASIACGDRGFFSHCVDGSRANNPGHFAYGTDGKLRR